MNQLAAISEFGRADPQVFAGARNDERVFRAATPTPTGIHQDHDAAAAARSARGAGGDHPAQAAGFTNDNRHYDLTAQAAAQDLTKPDVIELQGIRANVEMQNSISYETTALNGVYNSRTEMLTLQNNVVVTSSDGSRARLSEAVIDIRSRKMISEKSVEVKGLEWTLSGNRVEITEGGALIRFDRGVTMTLTPARNAARADAERRAR
jgi:hypothetical protein